MECPDTLDLALAPPGQLGGLLDRLVGGAQRNDSVVGFGVGNTADIFAS